MPTFNSFREGYSTQHELIKMIEKWKKFLDNSDVVGTVLVDLSKVYDCLPHDHLIAKLAANGFSVNGLYLMHDCLNNVYQRVKIGSVRSNPQNTSRGPAMVSTGPHAI